jgi:hypothetical protein
MKIEFLIKELCEEIKLRIFRSFIKNLFPLPPLYYWLLVYKVLFSSGFR